MAIAQELSEIPGVIMGGQRSSTPLRKFKIPFTFTPIVKQHSKPDSVEVPRPRNKFSAPGPVTKEQLAKLQEQMSQQMWKKKLPAHKGIKSRSSKNGS